MFAPVPNRKASQFVPDDYFVNVAGERMRWAATHCRWHWIWRVRPTADIFSGHTFDIGFLKFTHVPDIGEMISRKHFRGFAVSINLHPWEITYRRIRLGQAGSEPNFRTPSFRIAVDLTIPIKIKIKLRSLIKRW